MLILKKNIYSILIILLFTSCSTSSTEENNSTKIENSQESNDLQLPQTDIPEKTIIPEDEKSKDVISNKELNNSEEIMLKTEIPIEQEKEVVISEEIKNIDKENIEDVNQIDVSNNEIEETEKVIPPYLLNPSASNSEDLTEKIIKTESGKEIKVTENSNYEIVDRENKKISIVFPFVSEKTQQNIRTTKTLRTLKVIETPTISTVKLSVYYPDNSIYLENLEFQELNGVWEVELINFPVIAEDYRFKVDVFDDSNNTIMSGEISKNLTQDNSEVIIQMNYIEESSISLSLLTDVVKVIPNSKDENISITFKITNPSNDNNLSYKILPFSDTNISNFLNSDGISAILGNISSLTNSELNLTILNTFENNVSYKYRFILISGNGNQVTHNFEIFIPIETTNPNITLILPPVIENIFISINDNNISVEAVFSDEVAPTIIDTNWSLLNNSFQFENNLSNPATIIGFDGNISDTLILKVSDNRSGFVQKSYIINLNDEIAPNIPTAQFSAKTSLDILEIVVNGESNSKVVINNSISTNVITQSGSANIELSLVNNGDNNFSIALEDISGNRSPDLNITIFKDKTPPLTDSTNIFFETDDISPPLFGTLPTSDEDNISKYSVSILVNGNSYEAENNGTHWKVASSTVANLEEGFYDLNITASDDLNNSSTTNIRNAFRVSYSVFLINPKVEGLYFISGSKSGKTNISGLFKYENGENISLYLGNENSGIVVGTISLDFITEANNRKELDFLKLINGSATQNSQKSINVLRLLASLDADKDLSNGILIDSQTAEAFVLANPSFNLDVNSSDFSAIEEISDIFNDLSPHFGEHRGLISADDGESIINSLIAGEVATATFSTDESSTIEILTGQLQSIEGSVEGVAFRSGSQSGFTDENGTFFYEDGKKIRFSIGMMEFSETLAKSTMSPFDMVESVSFDHPKPRNISALFTIFDAISGDSKVSIDNAVISAIDMYRAPIDLNLPDGQANEDLNISASENEFMAQFNQFEIAYEMLEEINITRELESSRSTSSLRRLFSVTSTNMDSLKDLQISANSSKQVAEIYENVKDFHLFRALYNWNKIDSSTLLINGDNGFPVFSGRSDKDPHHTDYPINYNKRIVRYMPVSPPESVADQYVNEELGNKETAVYYPPIVSAGVLGAGKVLAMSSYIYPSILVNPRNYSENMRNNNKTDEPDSQDMENFFHNVFTWLSKSNLTSHYSKDGTTINLATNKEFTIFSSVSGWSFDSDKENFVIHNNFNVNQVTVTDFENLDPAEYPILILEEFSRHKRDTIQKRYLDKDSDLPHLLTYLRKGGSILMMESFTYPENEPKTIMESILSRVGIYAIRDVRNGIFFLPKHNKVGGVHQFDMCVQDFIGLTQLERKVGMTTYENVPQTKDLLIEQIKLTVGETPATWEGALDETLKNRERTIYKLGTESNSSFIESDCLVSVEDSSGNNTTVQSQLVKGNGISGDSDTWYKYDSYAKYPVDLNFVDAQGDMGGKMNNLLNHEDKSEIMSKVDVEREYTNMYALLMNDANFTGEKFETLNSLLDLYKDTNSSKVNELGEFTPTFVNIGNRKVLNYREKPVTRIMLERAFYDEALKFDATQFPGKVTAGNSETATIFLRKITNGSKWYVRNMQSTGLFAPAHENITITVPDGVDFTKLQVQIGVGDNVSGLIKHELILKRPPRMVKKYSFTSNSLTIKHPYGGLIFITSHDRNPASETATFNFDNVEKAILFKLGETTEGDWNNMIQYSAPKAELESNHFILTVARKNMSELSFDEVVDIANGFDEVVINSNDFYGYDRNCSVNIDDFDINTPPTCETRKGYKHREVFDPHISIGAGHSGYPLMLMTWNPESSAFPQNPRNSFILWHELGHNTVTKWLNIAGSTEVANNIMALYQQHRFNLPLKTSSRMENVGLIVNKSQSYADGGAMGRLLMFAQIPLWISQNHLSEFKTANPKYFETDGSMKSEFEFLDGSAWDIYKILHREARENNSTDGYRYKSCADNSNLNKTESFASCISSIINLDLTSFMQDWEIGVTGAGSIDGVSVYNSSNSFGSNGVNAISDLNLNQPTLSVQEFSR